ncbi:MAG: hypothetical protein KDK70_09995 [Myxococcales bacterium]|nr:hypothetical protein [Myxococcales bacterium]
MRAQFLAFFVTLPGLLASGCDDMILPNSPDATETDAAPEALEQEFVLPPQPLPDEDTPVAYAMLRAANELGFAALDTEVGLDHRAARSILEFRAGADGYVGTPDDRYLESIAQLDALYWMGEANLWALQRHALLDGLVLEELPEAACEPVLVEAIDRCLRFTEQAAGGEISTDELVASCTVASEPACPSSAFFADAGVVGHEDPLLGYFALLCDAEAPPELCDLGVAGIAAHLWPRCDARYDAG